MGSATMGPSELGMVDLSSVFNFLRMRGEEMRW